MPDLRDLIDRFDRLVTVADGIVDEGVLSAAAQVGRRARDRRGFLGDTVVVALAGGTGSGKSSLINALAGEVVAESGAQRPTTYAPLAWIPSNPEPGLVRLLDSIGVEDRVGQDRVPWLAVVDLPDTDSVSQDNRATVERVLPLVDAVVWVVDPEKYQDRVLHDRYLGPLARHSDRFVFVMNHIDRVDASEVEGLLHDLRATLEVDGISGSPEVLTTAADPPLGEPIGIDEFINAMQSLGSAKSIVERRLIADLDSAARSLAQTAGVSDGSGTGFNERWATTLAAAGEALARDLLGEATVNEAARIGARTARLSGSIRARAMSLPMVEVSAAPGEGTRAAIQTVDRTIADLIETVGSEHGESLRRVRHGIEDDIRDAAISVGASSAVELGPPPSRWRAIGVARPLVTLGIGGLGYWVANENGVLAPVPLIIGAVLGLLTWLAAGAILSSSGRNWGREAVSAQRQVLATASEREIDRRVGRPLRDALRIRASMGAAYTEFEMMRTAVEAATTPS